MKTFARTDTSVLGRWWWTVDRWVFTAFCILLLLGFLLNIAASPAVADRINIDSYYFVKRHALYLIPVIVVMIGISLLSPQQIRRGSLVVYASVLVLMLLTLVMGSEIKGAKRWVSMAGFSIQPSEFLKPVLVVMTAWMLAEKKRDETFPGYSLALILYFIPLSLLLLQPDMGMAILMTSVLFVQFFLSGVKVRYIVTFIGTSAVALVGAYFMFSHVSSRVNRFLFSDGGDRYGVGYQINQSLEAFMTGGLFGQGPGEGVVKNHLPDAHADFVLAVAAEEFGLILCLIIVGLFAFIVLRMIYRIFYENNIFIMLAVSGLVIEIALHALINMASNLNLIPTKGMTLPFISFGGSSMVAIGMGAGIILALTKRRVRGDPT